MPGIVKVPGYVVLAILWAAATAFRYPYVARKQRQRFEQAIPQFGLDQDLAIMKRRLASAGDFHPPDYQMSVLAEGSREQVLAVLSGRICAQGFSQPRPDANVGWVHVTFARTAGAITPGGIRTVSVVSYTTGYRIGIKGPVVPARHTGLVISFG